MQATVYDFPVTRLYEWGMRRVFGYPGDGINGVFGALQHVGDKIEFVQMRHEEMAAFMASAYAKFTDELGVCMAASRPDTAHLIADLYDAWLNRVLVLATTGQQARTVADGHYQQEVDLAAMFHDVAGALVHQASMPAQVRHLLDRMVRVAIGQRRATALMLPNNLQGMPYTEPPRAHDTVYSGVDYNAPSVIPQATDLERAANILNSGCQVAIFIGADALGANTEVVVMAGTLGADVAEALLDKAMLPDDLPYVTGAVGLLSTEPSWELVNHCNMLSMVGSSFPYAEFLPKESQAYGVQIDLDPGMLGLRYPMEVNLMGNSAQTLRTLLPLLQRKTGPHWPDRITHWNKSWRKTLEDHALQLAYPANPQHMFWELPPKLPDDVIVTSDSGTCANWYAHDLGLKPGTMDSLSGGLASMGAAVPYAIVTKFAHPRRPVIALVGDGAMQIDNMTELITVSKRWRHWKSSKWTYMVLDNQDLNEVTWEQRMMGGDPKFPAARDIPNVSYHHFVELIGLEGIYVDNPDQLAGAWGETLNADWPVVLEVKTDPDVPSLPPHVTLQQACNFAAALAYDDPDASGVLRGTARQVLPALFPVHKE